MEDNNSSTKAQAPKSEPGKPFRDMTLKEKVVYLLQVVICILTFGLVFPNAFG